jgi:uncharacterized membrane protein HdeD (DUF308 family)
MPRSTEPLVEAGGNAMQPFDFAETPTREVVDLARRHKVPFIALGVMLIVLGLVAVAFTGLTTLGSMLFLSGVLLASGAIRIFSAFRAQDWTGSLLLALSGILYIVAGVLTFRHPLAAAAALTLLFSAVFLGAGLFRVTTALWYRFQNWGAVALGGAVSMLLGLLLYLEWPFSGLWFIGLCIGIDLIAEGVGWIMLASRIREPAKA